MANPYGISDGVWNVLTPEEKTYYGSGSASALSVRSVGGNTWEDGGYQGGSHPSSNDIGGWGSDVSNTSDGSWGVSDGNIINRNDGSSRITASPVVDYQALLAEMEQKYEQKFIDLQKQFQTQLTTQNGLLENQNRYSISNMQGLNQSSSNQQMNNTNNPNQFNITGYKGGQGAQIKGTSGAISRYLAKDMWNKTDSV